MLGTVRELEIVTNPYGPQSGEVILKLNEAPQGILIIQWFPSNVALSLPSQGCVVSQLKHLVCACPTRLIGVLADSYTYR